MIPPAPATKSESRIQCGFQASKFRKRDKRDNFLSVPGRKKMPKRKIQSNRLALHYRPAKLHKGKEWFISYYVTDPGSGQWRRIRVKWNMIQDSRHRLASAREEIRAINARLKTGWNPLVKTAGTRYFAPIRSAVEHFLQEKTQQVEEGGMRSETLRSYISFLKNLREWAGEAHWKGPCSWIDQRMVDEFLDHIYLERRRSARTRNNYLCFFRTFGHWLKRKRYIPEVPTTDIERIHEPKKRRTIIDSSRLKEIFTHLQQTDPSFYTACRTIYYCLIRRREMSFLKVEHVNLERRTILIPGDFSKNGKDAVVTIPSPLLHDLVAHLKGRKKPHWYVFSANGLKPGPKRVDVKKISDTWAKVRKKLKLPPGYQFYSFKDTGITNMLMNSLPILVVRDQARHYDISVTDRYTPKGMTKAAPELLDYQG